MDTARTGKRTSVIIVTHNGLRYLEQCLSSVRQNIQDSSEIVVVDNASTDGSVDFIRRYYPDVVLVSNSTNCGFAAACNQGARAAAGKFLVFLNQDTLVLPGWLDPLIDGLVNDERIALTTSKILLMSQPDRIQLCGQHVHYTGFVFGNGFLSAAEEMTVSQRVAAVSGASFAVRREIWTALGGFDEAFYMYYEDTDLSWRAQLAGYSCLYVPGSVVYHDYRLSRPSTLSLYYSGRNRWVMLAKNWRWITLVLLIPGLVLADMLDWGLALVRGSQGILAKIRANVWVVRHLPDLIRLHKDAQSRRKTSDLMLLTERTPRLMPIETTVGLAGNVIVAISGLLFSLHYRMVLWVARKRSF